MVEAAQDEIRTASPRAAILVGAAFVERHLEYLLRARMTPVAETQVLAELMNLVIAAALAEPSWERDLVRPAAINARWRQLALAPHHRTAA